MTTDRVSDDRLKEIAAEFAEIKATLPDILPDGPGAVSALYTSLSIAEVAALASELPTLREAVKNIEQVNERSRKIGAGDFYAIREAIAKGTQRNPGASNV